VITGSSLSVLRPRPDWLPRASVGLGIGATIAMNVAAGSRGGLGGALAGTLPPAGFVISLETLIWLVRRLARLPWGWAWCAGAGIPLAGLAAITGVISYLHALTVAIWTASPGEAGLPLTEHLLPLVADLMIVTGSVALVALAVAGRPAGKVPAGAGGRAVAVRPPLAAPRQPVSPAGKKPRPASHPEPGGIPEQVVRDAMRAGHLTQRTLAAAVREAGYPQYTRHAATRALKAVHANGHLTDKER
jgi:hypothetical protein